MIPRYGIDCKYNNIYLIRKSFLDFFLKNNLEDTFLQLRDVIIYGRKRLFFY